MMIHRVAGKSPSRWWLGYQGFDSYGACSQGMSLLENLQGYIRFLAPQSVGGVLQILQSILVILVFIWLVTTVLRRLGPRQETWTASTGPVLEIWRWSSPNRLMHLQSLGVCDPMVLSLKPLFNLSKGQPLCSQQVGPPGSTLLEPPDFWPDETGDVHSCFVKSSAVISRRYFRWLGLLLLSTSHFPGRISQMCNLFPGSQGAVTKTEVATF